MRLSTDNEAAINDATFWAYPGRSGDVADCIAPMGTQGTVRRGRSGRLGFGRVGRRCRI
jgi:hypothetical protein